MSLHNDESTVPLPNLTLNFSNKRDVSSSILFNSSSWSLLRLFGACLCCHKRQCCVFLPSQGFFRTSYMTCKIVPVQLRTVHLFHFYRHPVSVIEAVSGSALSKSVHWVGRNQSPSPKPVACVWPVSLIYACISKMCGMQHVHMFV